MKIPLAAFLSAALCASAGAASPEIAKAARATSAAEGDAVILLEVVVLSTSSRGGQTTERERKREVAAFIVDESGLAVTSLEYLDQNHIGNKMRGGEESNNTSKLRSAKYLLADGTEVPATMVFRDDDLDIAFLRPAGGTDRKFSHIDLTATTTAEPFDELFVLGREGMIARRILGGASGIAAGKVTKPREYIIPDAGLAKYRRGAPVFAADGQLVGMMGIYVHPGGRKAMDGNEQPSQTIIVPAAELARLAAEAPKNAPKLSEPDPPPPTPPAAE